jgi:hypothetical protein
MNRKMIGRKQPEAKSGWGCIPIAGGIFFAFLVLVSIGIDTGLLTTPPPSGEALAPSRTPAEVQAEMMRDIEASPARKAMLNSPEYKAKLRQTEWKNAHRDQMNEKCQAARVANLEAVIRMNQASQLGDETEFDKWYKEMNKRADKELNVCLCVDHPGADGC